MSDEKDIKGEVQKRFGTYAQNYVTSSVHATGEDLDIILELAQVDANARVLDVATGGGHTALKFAPHVKHVVASDLTQKMLDAASAFVAPKAQNVSFELADAEALPFEEATFDVVTCRIAPHHFPDIFRFVLEAARVLKPGGRLIIEDHVAPDDEQAADYIDAFERLRDPSHVKAYSAIEWRGVYLDAGLLVGEERRFQRNALFIPWVERQNRPPDVVERLEIMLLQAPDAVREWLQPRAIGTPDAAFTHHYIIIAGQKPSS